MRHIAAAIAVFALLATACGGGDIELVEEADDTTLVVEPAHEPAPVEAVPADGELLEELGELLASAAATGGDALERTLTFTAVGEHDTDCAPSWAHELLEAEDGRSASVQLSDGAGMVGGVAVPADVIAGRALHLGGDCDGPLPQPDRSPAPERAEKDQAQQAAITAPTAPTAPAQAAATPTPAPATPAPPVATGRTLVTGELRVDSSFGGSMLQHVIPDCSGMGDRSYQIKVLDGSDAIVALGVISGETYSREDFSYGTFVTCDYSYTIELTDAPVYTFVVAARAGDQEEDRRVLSPQDLASRGAPKFYIQNNYRA